MSSLWSRRHESTPHLLDSLEKDGYIKTKRVRKAMEKVPREAFLREGYETASSMDSPLPIGHGQTISAPHMVAMMCEHLEVEAGNKILEVGGGSGYHASVLGVLAGSTGEVTSIEYVLELVPWAQKNVESLGLENVSMVHGDGSLGYPDRAPFDRISVAAASPGIPEPLMEQLAEGGIIVIPVGTMRLQELVVAKKVNGKIKSEYRGGCVFVPLLGKHGF